MNKAEVSYDEGYNAAIKRMSERDVTWCNINATCIRRRSESNQQLPVRDLGAAKLYSI